VNTYFLYVSWYILVKYNKHDEHLDHADIYHYLKGITLEAKMAHEKPHLRMSPGEWATAYISSVECSHCAPSGGGGSLINRYRFKRALVAQLVGRGACVVRLLPRTLLAPQDHT
jgi:hypothetical protein